MADEKKPDFKNPNREPFIGVMGLASLDDVKEGYRCGAAALRSRGWI